MVFEMGEVEKGGVVGRLRKGERKTRRVEMEEFGLHCGNRRIESQADGVGSFWRDVFK